jgi:hypothetical protein
MKRISVVRKRVVAWPPAAGSLIPQRRPDFLARLRSIYGDKKLKVSGAKLLAGERDRL